MGASKAIQAAATRGAERPSEAEDAESFKMRQLMTMLERWNDEKMDVLDRKVDGVDTRLTRLEVRVDEGFKNVDKRLESVEGELREQQREMKAGFESLHRLMVQAAVGLSAAFLTGFAVLVGVIATKL